MNAATLAVVLVASGCALLAVAQQGGCNNDADIATIKAHWDTFDDQVDHCGTTCLTRRACSLACIRKDVGTSANCSGCFADSIVCAAEHCLVPCTKDHKSKECRSCHEANCMAPLLNCTGLKPDQLPP